MTDATRRHGLGGWDWRGTGEGIKKGFVLAKEKRRGVRGPLGTVREGPLEYPLEN